MGTRTQLNLRKVSHAFAVAGPGDCVVSVSVSTPSDVRAKPVVARSEEAKVLGVQILKETMGPWLRVQRQVSD